MSEKEQSLPNSLQHLGVATKQPRRHIVPQHRDDRGPAGTNRITVTCAVHSVVRPDADHRGFLFVECLNARDLWHKTTFAKKLLDLLRQRSTRRSDPKGAGQKGSADGGTLIGRHSLGRVPCLAS